MEIKLEKNLLPTQQLMKNIALAACIVASTFWIHNAYAKDHSKTESACFDYVQDKIKWDYNHRSRWEPHNIKQLCRGTENIKEPGNCFHEVMHGGQYDNDGINWGGGTRWDWQNALALCSGANSADKRIGCFKGHIKEGHQWQESIAACILVDR